MSSIEFSRTELLAWKTTTSWTGVRRYTAMIYDCRVETGRHGNVMLLVEDDGIRHTNPHVKDIASGWLRGRCKVVCPVVHARHRHSWIPGRKYNFQDNKCHNPSPPWGALPESGDKVVSLCVSHSLPHQQIIPRLALRSFGCQGAAIGQKWRWAQTRMAAMQPAVAWDPWPD
jgi:ribosome modulation factor